MHPSPMSRHRRWRLWSRIGSECVAAVLLSAASTASVAAPAGPQAPASGRAAAPSQPPIVIDAGFSRVDYTSNTVIFRNIVVSQGDTRLTAARARASGVGFANSQWTFEDDVVIDLAPRGSLRCDQAVVTFRDNRVTGARASGKPAQFEQRSSGSRRPAHGSADQIVYDAKDDSVRLSGGAHFSDSRGFDVSGPTLVYDIRAEQLQAASSGGGRSVHIVVGSGVRSRGGKPAADSAPRR